MIFKLQEELDLSAVNRTAMMGLPNEKKWQLYCSQRLQGSTNNGGLNGGNEHTRDGSVQSVWTTGGLSNDPQAYVDKVRVSVGMVSYTLFLMAIMYVITISLYND